MMQKYRVILEVTALNKADAELYVGRGDFSNPQRSRFIKCSKIRGPRVKASYHILYDNVPLLGHGSKIKPDKKFFDTPATWKTLTGAKSAVKKFKSINFWQTRNPKLYKIVKV
jgi:hypothetical protein